MFLADEPIPSSADDILGRKPFADALAEAILLQKGVEPLVIGLLGPWGCGKSSILRMMKEHFEARASALPESGRPLLVPFFPWLVADEAALFTQFFDAIIDRLGHVNYAKGIRRTAKLAATFQSYSEALSVVSMAPSPIAALLGMVPKALKGMTWFMTWASLQANSAQAQKAKLDVALQNQSHKLVIVIDDIDRLPTTEVRQLFQLVKSLANFPNTIYVLAFDNKVVEKQLAELHVGDGVAFLEKIVQVPFYVPEILVDDVHRYTREMVLEMFRTGGIGLDEKHFHCVFENGIRPLVKNLRDAKRYLNVLRFTMHVCRGKIAPTDIIGLTAIHVLEPAVFDAIRANKTLLTAASGPTPGSEMGRSDALTRMNAISKQQRQGSEVPINALLALLFPKAHVILNGKQETIGHELKVEWRVTGRVCDPINFDFFFKLSLPRHEYSNEEIVTTIHSATTPQECESTLLRAFEQGRLGTLLEGCTRHVPHFGWPAPVTKTLVETLINIGDELIAEQEVGETQEHPTALQHLIIDTIKAAAECIPAYAREATLIEPVAGAERSLMVPILVNQRLLKNNDSVTQTICEKIANWTEGGRLLKHQRVGALLNFWESNGARAEQIATVIDQILRDDEALLNLVREYVNHNPLRAQDYYTPTPIQVHTENLKQRIDPARAYEQLRIMQASSSGSRRDRHLIRAALEALTEYKGKQGLQQEKKLP